MAIGVTILWHETSSNIQTDKSAYNLSHDKFIAYYATDSEQAGISDRSLLEPHTLTPKTYSKTKQGDTSEMESADENIFLGVADQMFSVEEPEPINILSIEKVASQQSAAQKDTSQNATDQDFKAVTETAEVKTIESETTDKSFVKAEDKTAIEKFTSLPFWKKFSAPTEPQTEKPRVVIIIDDMGLNKKTTKTITKLPGPLELSFLPYASGVAQQAKMAREAGHEIMIHMPMEPINHHIDTGPIALKMDMEPKVFDAHLNLALGSMSGYVGINNHMGSRLTQNKDAMERLMATLKEKGLLFVDSRTIHTSIAAETAAAYNVPYAIRDIFIDHVPTKEGVEASLKLIEEMALRRGIAIAIGHPKKVTINALQKWLPTLEKKGIVLTPVSQVVRKPSVDVSKHAESHLLQRQ